jgi:hypothetical protein
MNIQQLFEDAQNDPSLLSTLDINQLLNSLENKNNDYLVDKTFKNIHDDVFNIVKTAILPDKVGEICKKLSDYRYVDEIYELHKGKHVRWIKDNKLTNGGIVVDIKFLDNGVHILCLNNQRRLIQYKFDGSITFQKLSVDEQLILMAYENL